MLCEALHVVPAGFCTTSQYQLASRQALRAVCEPCVIEYDTEKSWYIYPYILYSVNNHMIQHDPIITIKKYNQKQQQDGACRLKAQHSTAAAAARNSKGWAAEGQHAEMSLKASNKTHHAGSHTISNCII